MIALSPSPSLLIVAAAALVMSACGGEAPGTFTLALVIEGEGSLSSEPPAVDCIGPKVCPDVNLLRSTDWQLKPIPNSGYQFSHWVSYDGDGKATQVPPDGLSLVVRGQEVAAGARIKMAAQFVRVATGAPGSSGGQGQAGGSRDGGGADAMADASPPSRPLTCTGFTPIAVKPFKLTPLELRGTGFDKNTTATIGGGPPCPDLSQCPTTVVSETSITFPVYTRTNDEEIVVKGPGAKTASCGRLAVLP